MARVKLIMMMPLHRQAASMNMKQKIKSSLYAMSSKKADAD